MLVSAVEHSKHRSVAGDEPPTSASDMVAPTHRCVRLTSLRREPKIPLGLPVYEATFPSRFPLGLPVYRQANQGSQGEPVTGGRHMTALNITTNDLTDTIAETRRQVTAYNDNVGEALEHVFGGGMDKVERRLGTS